MPLGLTDNRHVVHNLCLILGKTLTPDSAQLYNEPQNRNLLHVTILVMQYWLLELADGDSFVLNNSVEILENLVASAAFWEHFKSNPIVARLLSLSKHPQTSGTTKSRIIKIVTYLSRTQPDQYTGNYRRVQPEHDYPPI